MRKSKGFTLIEILLAITIFSLVIGMGCTVLGSSFRIWAHDSKFLTIGQKGQVVLEILSQNLRKASNITIGENQIEFKGFYKGEKKWIIYRIYESGGVSALGIRTGEKDDYSLTSPVMNGVEELNVSDIYGDMSLIRIMVKIKSETYSTTITPAKEE